VLDDGSSVTISGLHIAALEKEKNSGHDLPNRGGSSETAAGKEKEV